MIFLQSRVSYIKFKSSPIVEKKSSFLPEKSVFSTGSKNRGFPLWQKGPMPGQKGIRLAKKGGGPSLAKCGLLRFVVKPPLSPRVSLRKQRRRELGRFDPNRFCLRRLPFFPGNVEAVPNHQLIFMTRGTAPNYEKELIRTYFLLNSKGCSHSH